MLDSVELFGISLGALLWCLGKCSIEVGNAEDLDGTEANQRLLTCVIDCATPGLPDPDRYDGKEDDNG